MTIYKDPQVLLFYQCSNDNSSDMKFILLATVLAVTAYAAPTDEWNEYKAKYKKVYTSETENMRRLEQYLKTKEMVEEHNRKYDRGETTYTMAINHFADWFPEERNRLNGLKPGESRSEAKPLELPPGTVVPDSINWVKKGAVTSVKDQDACGSCYAFSSVGALEGLMFIKNHTLQELSVQELVDCSGNNGCDGGWLHTCFKYVAKKGIHSEKDYPYTAKEYICRANETSPTAYCTGYKFVRDEEDLKNVVGTLGPVSIPFAAHDVLLTYQNGIFDGPCDVFQNHGMLVVGYGTDEKTKTDYWLIKNSWGTNWGEEGYARVVRNKNKCYLADAAVYPI